MLTVLPCCGAFGSGSVEEALEMKLAALAAPVLCAAVMLYAALKGVEVYSVLLRGAGKGLKLALELMPTLAILFSAIYMLKGSGLLKAVTEIFSPLLSALGVPPETGIIVLLRPISGSGALAAATELMKSSGADSLLGRTAAVMLGASETTLYVTAVYFSAAGVKDSRWAVPAALCADAACFLSSAWICRLFWG